jgi:hypothetical protein
MKDFVKEYKHKKLIWNIWVITISLILALWINFFILDWTSLWKNLKASILDVNTEENKADFYLENNWNSIIVKNSKTMQVPVSISLSLAYNPEVLEINEIGTSLWNITILWEKDTWNETILLNLNWTTDIIANTSILQVDTTKKEETSTQINMLNANFKDMAGEQYNLTTSGITF